MQQFFLKLNPPRPQFMMDMTADEKVIMQLHVSYWNDLLGKGIAIVFGPVLDPKGVYGAGVVPAENEKKLKQLIADDPASGLNKYEYYPMKAVYKNK